MSATEEQLHATWPTWVGKQVSKESGKPFKSGEKVATVLRIIAHPITKAMTFYFGEADMYVECRRCVLETGKLNWAEAPAWAVGQAVKAFGDDRGSWVWRDLTHEPGYLNHETRPVEHLARADERVVAHVRNMINGIFELKEKGRLLQQAKGRMRNAQQKLIAALKLRPLDVAIPESLLGNTKGEDLARIADRAERLMSYSGIARALRIEQEPAQIIDYLVKLEGDLTTPLEDLVEEFWKTR